MKIYKKIKSPDVSVIDKVTCDRCGEDCTNTFFDILVRMSFCKDPSFVETICHKCFDELFREKVINKLNSDKNSNAK